jgi:hypothetical protein
MNCYHVQIEPGKRQLRAPGTARLTATETRLATRTELTDVDTNRHALHPVAASKYSAVRAP